MKNLILLIIVLSTAACSTTKSPTSEKSDLNQDNIKLHRANCLEKGVAIDCAKYAYLIKPTNPAAAVDYYKKACDLGEKNSCFNLKAIEDRSYELNNNLLANKDNDIYGCYSSFLQKPEDHKLYVVNTIKVRVEIEPTGKIKSIKVSDYKDDSEGVKCIKNAINSIKFLPGKDAIAITREVSTKYMPFK